MLPILLPEVAIGQVFIVWLKQRVALSESGGIREQTGRSRRIRRDSPSHFRLSRLRLCPVEGASGGSALKRDRRVQVRGFPPSVADLAPSRWDSG